MRTGPFNRERGAEGNIAYGDTPTVFHGTVVVSVGRSLPKGGTLSWADWTSFTDHILDACHDFGEVVFAGSGTGFYLGNAEESYTVVVAGASFSDADRNGLAYFAAAYGQDCVAVTLGNTDLVAPE